MNYQNSILYSILYFLRYKVLGLSNLWLHQTAALTLNLVLLRVLQQKYLFFVLLLLFI